MAASCTVCAETAGLVGQWRPLAPGFLHGRPRALEGVQVSQCASCSRRCPSAPGLWQRPFGPLHVSHFFARRGSLAAGAPAPAPPPAPAGGAASSTAAAARASSSAASCKRAIAAGMPLLGYPVMDVGDGATPSWNSQSQSELGCWGSTSFPCCLPAPDAAGATAPGRGCCCGRRSTSGAAAAAASSKSRSLAGRSRSTESAAPVRSLART